MMIKTVFKFKNNKLNQLASPDTESSIVKNVSLSDLEQVKKLLKREFKNAQFRVKYRGPRHDFSRGTCLKRNARSCAIYFTSDSETQKMIYNEYYKRMI